MDAATLARAMGCSQAVADRYVAGMNAAMVQAGCTTVNRAAMWCAQVGHDLAIPARIGRPMLYSEACARAV